MSGHFKCWGGGGGAGSGSSSPRAGGGGGGGFSQSTLAVSPGQILYIQVGQGGVRGNSSNSSLSTSSNADAGGISYVKTGSQNGTTICLANGGGGGDGGSNGANGGNGANTTGAVSNSVTARSGGSGGNGSGSRALAGGGGGSGGFGGNGQAATNTGCGNCGSGTNGNGSGGSGGAAGGGSPGYTGATATSCGSPCGSYQGVSPNANFYGAGAAGGSRSSSQQNGANGAPGYVEISFSVSNPTNGLVSVNGNTDPSQVVDVCIGSSISVSQSGWNNEGGTTYFYSDLAASLWGWEEPSNRGWTIIDYGSITASNQVGGQTNVNNQSSFNFKVNSTGIYLLHTNAVSPTGCYATGVNRYITVNAASPPQAVGNIVFGPVASANGSALIGDANISAATCWTGCIGGGA